MSYENDVREYQNSKEEDSRECEAMRKMFVGALNRSTDEEAFFNHFSQFGEVVDKVIIRNNVDGKESRGFGFITYAKSESVENAFKARPHNLDGKQLDVKRAMPREYNTPGAHSKTKKLFVGGFKGLDLTTDELQAYIESRHSTDLGRIEKIDFFKDNATGSLKGFGFIECSDTDFADRLAISESSFSLKGRSMSIKKAEPKEGPGAAPRGRGGAGGGRSYGGGFGGNSRGDQNYNSSYGGGNQGGYNNYGGSGYGSGPQQQSRGGGYSQPAGGYNQGGGNYGQNTGGYAQNLGYESPNQGYSQPQSGGYGQGRGGYNQRGGNYNSPVRGGGRGGGRGGAPRGGRGGGGGGGQRFQPY